MQIQSVYFDLIPNMRRKPGNKTRDDKHELDCKNMLKTALDPDQINITLAAIRQVNGTLFGKN